MSHHHRNRRRDDLPDLDETKAHIFLAGHELLKAAEGALKFCKSYMESTCGEKPHPNMSNFFSKAISIAGELGRSMIKGVEVKQAIENTARTFCNKIEREMRCQATKRGRGRRAPKGRQK